MRGQTFGFIGPQLSAAVLTALTLLGGFGAAAAVRRWPKVAT